MIPWLIVGLIILLVVTVWVVLWVVINPNLFTSETQSNDSSETKPSRESTDVTEVLPEALHETCYTRCASGKVCDGGACKQDIGQPCAQNIDCAYGSICANWVCGGIEETLSVNFADLKSNSQSNPRTLDSKRAPRRVEFV